MSLLKVSTSLAQNKCIDEEYDLTPLIALRFEYVAMVMPFLSMVCKVSQRHLALIFSLPPF